MSNINLKSPCSYQGAKVRIADKIIETINPSHDKSFYDVCCGSGSVSLALINSGFPPQNITMIDSANWGEFWVSLFSDEFDIDVFREYIKRVPDDKELIQGYVKELSQTDDVSVYVYLILQSCSFGGKQLWSKNGVWKNNTFRSFWKPKPNSSRQYTVNPCMPMPDELLSRVEMLFDYFHSIKDKPAAFHSDILEIEIPHNSIIYIDPPYENTTSYFDSFDYMGLANRLIDNGNDVWVSEQKPLTTSVYIMDKKRTKGGVSGSSKRSKQEWLSYFPAKQKDII